MYRDRSSTRPPLAQAGPSRFDAATDSPGSSPVEPRSTWVGAFERVMGDQAELLNSERRSRPTQPRRPSPPGSQAPESTPSQGMASPTSYYSSTRTPSKQPPPLSLTLHLEESDGRRAGGSQSTSSSSFHALTIDFGDILVGTATERIILLGNPSELPCFWHARFEDSDNMLLSEPIEVVDIATSTAVAVAASDAMSSSAGEDTLVPPPLRYSILNPHEERRLAIRLKPSEPCRDYEQTITFTDPHDAMHSQRVVVRANMLGHARHDDSDAALVVLSGDAIDFGDCFAGQWTQRTMIIKNMGDVLLEAAFSAQKGAEVVFRLPDPATNREDLDTDEFASEGAESSAPPSVSASGTGGGDDFFLAGPSGAEAIAMDLSTRSHSPFTTNAGQPASHVEPIPVVEGSARASHGLSGSTAPAPPLDMAETPRNAPQLFGPAAQRPSELNLALPYTGARETSSSSSTSVSMIGQSHNPSQTQSQQCNSNPWSRLQIGPAGVSAGTAGTDDDSDMDRASLVSQGGSSRPSSPGTGFSIGPSGAAMHSSMIDSQYSQHATGMSAHQHERQPHRRHESTHPTTRMASFGGGDVSPSGSGERGVGNADFVHHDAAATFRTRVREVGTGGLGGPGLGSDGSIMSGYLASGHESDRGSAVGGGSFRTGGSIHGPGARSGAPSSGFTRHWAAAHLGVRPSSSMTRASRVGRDEGERHEDGTSSMSDITAPSQDSRIGPFPASSMYSASGVGGGGARHHRPGYATLGSGLRPLEQPHSTQVEELFLRPGTEYRVIVSYRPPRSEVDENFSAGQLQPTTFTVSIDYARARVGGARSRGGRERKTVTCHLRTCTSFITVEPKFIDFGEVNVGSRKHAMVTVTNRSALTTRIDTRVVSKVISMFAEEVLVTPQRPYELELQFYPRRVNDKYRKQITIANLFNRSNDQIVEVRAQNVDSEGISLHSMFYSILTPTGANFLDFGEVNINSTRVRTLTVVNISSSKIVLELDSATPEDLVLYVKPDHRSSLSRTAEDSAALVDVDGNDAVASPADGPRIATGSQVDASNRASQGRPADGADLKERFLEALATDVTVPARRENKTWRQAQRRAQHARHAGTAANAVGEVQPSKPKPTINLLAALKKGGKGRLTVQSGKSIAFKDRTLLREFEYLDLATGSPLDARRQPPKNRRPQNLESGEGGSKLRSRGSIRRRGAGAEVPSTVKETKTLAQKLIERHDPHVFDDGSSSSSVAVNGDTKRQPALTAKRKAPDALGDSTDLSQLSISELIAAVERQPDKLSSFYLNNPQAEERHVRMEINLQRELQKAITNDRLQRFDLLELEPGQERQVIVVLCPNGSTRPHITGNARKQDLRINFRLVKYDASVLHNTTFGGSERATDETISLPIRELMVRTTVCRSIMELGQAHINLGVMEKGETKARKILIQNRGEWALRYCIKKSGSIVSGDIKLGSGRYGVVPGHGKREVEFIFSPSYIGQLQEKLVIEDVADHADDQTIQLKAQVRKLPNFTVEPTAVPELGLLRPGETSEARSFLVTNVTAKARKFVIYIEEADLRLRGPSAGNASSTSLASGDGDVGDVEYVFDVAVTAATFEAAKPTLTQAEEDEVEHISQKLKVAVRKGQADKVAKYEERLAQLGVSVPVVAKGESGGEGSEASSAVIAAADQGHDPGITAQSGALTLNGNSVQSPEEGGKQAPTSAPVSSSSSSRLQRQGATATFNLDANESLRMILHVRATRSSSSALDCNAHVASTPGVGSAQSQASAHDAVLPLSDIGQLADAQGLAAVDQETATLGTSTRPFSISVLLHEHKNKDETSTVTLAGGLLLSSSSSASLKSVEGTSAAPATTVWSSSFVFSGHNRS